ncbi:hypothetical protein AB0K43_16555 [Kitasatospora sp. NPDC049258]|uniref:hypothetical protein n=1 Tax=Kitasatospora sp. NPDC049258 TaxID=3155394 RepID=UPI003449C9A4
MTTKFSDVLTRGGVDGEADPERSWSTPRASLAGRFLDSLTHSGPGYCPASAEELADHAAAGRQAKAELVEFLRTSVGQVIAIRESMAAMESAGGGQRDLRRADAERTLREFLEFFDDRWPSTLRAVRETLGPLDFRGRHLISRLARAQRKAVDQIAGLADELAQQGRRPGTDAFSAARAAGRSTVGQGAASAADRVNRSLTHLLHSAARSAQGRPDGRRAA